MEVAGAAAAEWWWQVRRLKKSCHPVYRPLEDGVGRAGVEGVYIETALAPPPRNSAINATAILSTGGDAAPDYGVNFKRVYNLDFSWSWIVNDAIERLTRSVRQGNVRILQMVLSLDWDVCRPLRKRYGRDLSNFLSHTAEMRSSLTALPERFPLPGRRQCITGETSDVGRRELTPPVRVELDSSLSGLEVDLRIAASGRPQRKVQTQSFPSTRGGFVETSG